MGLKTEVDQILQQSLHVAYRPPEAGLTIAAHNLFVLSGGPALVLAFFAYADTATAGASTLQVTACGVNLENAAVACNLLIGEMAMWPLQPAALSIIIPNVASTPCPTLATQIQGQQGLLMSPGSVAGDFFVLTVGAAIAAGFLSFFCVYYKLRPETLIAPVP